MGERPQIVGIVNSMQEENEVILDRAAVNRCFKWNPVHVAASGGQEELFKKLLDSYPELAEVLDSQQRSLLHLASANGHVEIVKELIKMRPEMCLARDRDGTNPLHVAAIRGKVEVLDVLFQANPHAARARVDRGETVLQLCIKYNKLECLKLMLEKFQSEEFEVNAKDDDGNNILHLAVADHALTDQRFQIINHVLSNTKIEVNATNASKQTAMDILLLRQGTQLEAVEDRGIAELLRKFHAKRHKDTIDPTWITEQRNALIIVAALMATIAFQAGLTPPGGVWPETAHGHKGGEAMMASKDPHLYRYFLGFNTIGFVASLITILLLIIEFPFPKRRYVWLLVVIMCIALTSMTVTYSILIAAITPNCDRFLPIVIGVVAWCAVIAILLPVHTIRGIANIVSEKKSRNQAVERLRKLGRAITHSLLCGFPRGTRISVV